MLFRSCWRRCRCRRWSGRGCWRWCRRRNITTIPVQLEPSRVTAPSINRDAIGCTPGRRECHGTRLNNAVLNIVIENYSGQCPEAASGVYRQNRVEVTTCRCDRSRAGRWRLPLIPDGVTGTQRSAVGRIVTRLPCFARRTEIDSSRAARTSANCLCVCEVVIRRWRRQRWWRRRRVIVHQVVSE